VVKIVWSGNALADLRNIYTYIKHDSPKYAAKVIDNILKSTRKLELTPSLGRIIPEVQKQNFKELLFGNYRIMFKIVSKEEILILAIFHAKRNFEFDKIEPIES
jgi:plasmid stabilization system protein ParE